MKNRRVIIHNSMPVSYLHMYILLLF